MTEARRAACSHSFSLERSCCSLVLFVALGLDCIAVFCTSFGVFNGDLKGMVSFASFSGDLKGDAIRNLFGVANPS